MKYTVWSRILLLSSAVVAVPFVSKPSCNTGPSLQASDQSILVSEAPDQSVQSNCEPLNTNATSDTLIGTLWRNNCDIVQKFLNNNFAIEAVQNYSYDDAFRYYSVQDYYYLLETGFNKAYLLESRLPTSDQIYGAVNDMQNGIIYSADFRQNLVKSLAIKETIVDGGRFNAAGVEYVRWLQANTNLGWYAYQVSRIACVYGWSELANYLNGRNDKKMDTLFYKEWVKPNLDWKYGNEMLEKLQGPVPDVNSDTFKAYNILFRQGLAFEIAFFESAIDKNPEDSLD